MSDESKDEGGPESDEPKIRYFVEKFGLTQRQARDLIREHGPDPDKAEELARRYRDIGG